MVVLPSHVCSQCTAARATSHRPSAVSHAPRLVEAPHSSIFGWRRARAGSVSSPQCRVSQSQRSWAFLSHPPMAVLPFVCDLSMHGASRALAPALGRLARVASRRGSPLGHLRSTSRARSLRCLGLDVVAHGHGVLGRFSRVRRWLCCLRACALTIRRFARQHPGSRPSRSRRVSSRLPTRPSSVGVARTLAPYLRLGRRVSQSRCSWSLLSHPPMAVLPLRVRSQCTAPRVQTPRLSAVSLVSRFVAVPHWAIFGRRRARACSVPSTRASCLTALASAFGRFVPVASRRGLPLGHLRSTSLACSLRCPRLMRRVLQSRRLWSLFLHPPMAVLSSRVCSQCMAPRAPSLRPSPVCHVFVASRRGSPLGHLRWTSRARSPRCFRLDVVAHRHGVLGRFSRVRQWRCCLRARALNAWSLARQRPSPRPSRSRRVLSRLPTRPSSVNVARALAPLPSARASCLTVAAFVVVSLAPAAPALGRLARAASRRGSPLGHLRSASRARWLRTITLMSCLTVAAFVGVSLAPANGGAAFVCVLSIHGASRALAPALSRLARAATRRGSPLGHLRSTSRARSPRCLRLDVVAHSHGVLGRFSRVRQWRCCLRACALNARRLARQRPGPRPSRMRRVSLRLPTRPSSVDVAHALAPYLRLGRRARAVDAARAPSMPRAGRSTLFGDSEGDDGLAAAAADARDWRALTELVVRLVHEIRRAPNFTKK